MKKLLLVIVSFLLAIVARAQCDLPFIVGLNTICSSGTTTLTNDSAGGYWVNMSPTVATITDLGTSCVVHPVSAGSAVIAYIKSMPSCPLGSFIDTQYKVLHITADGPTTPIDLGPWETISFCNSSSGVTGYMPTLHHVEGVNLASPHWYSLENTTYPFGIVHSIDSLTGAISVSPSSPFITPTNFIKYNFVQDGCSYVERNQLLVYDLPRPRVFDGRYVYYVGIQDSIKYDGDPSFPYYWYMYSGYGENYYSSGMYDGRLSLSTSWNMIAPVGSLLTTDSVKAFVMPVHYGDMPIRVSMTNVCGTAVDTVGLNIAQPTYGGDGNIFAANAVSNCSHVKVYKAFDPHATPYMVVSRYGDGSSDTLMVPASTISASYPTDHIYSAAGAYTLSHVVYNGTTPIDSVTYTYNHVMCQTIPLNYYVDNNSNCSFDAGDVENESSIRIGIDSAGVAIDTISVINGTYYYAYGVPGTTYNFRLISSVYSSPCSLSGFSYTLPGYDAVIPMNNIGLSCIAPGADLSILTTGNARRRSLQYSVRVSNSRCTVANARLVLNHSTLYTPSTIVPAPDSIIGQTLIWHLNNLSAAGNSDTLISIIFNESTFSTYGLPVGTLVPATFTVYPFADDIDTMNNKVVRNDTVRASYDPNYIQANPDGGVLNGTRIHFAVEFENCGNDTARNIHVMDTLSSYLDPSTLVIEGATKNMYVSQYSVGGYNIVKFDFPNIMLPDSSHHGYATAQFYYNIKAKTGLADGTNINSRVGIYFDENEVVMTNTAVNTIVIPNVVISSSATEVCYTDSAHFTAAPHSVNIPLYQWYVNATAVGTNSNTLSVGGLVSGDVVSCMMRTTMDDTIWSNSNLITASVVGEPSAGSIPSTVSLCTGMPYVFTGATAGSVWNVVTGNASISSSGEVTGVLSGVDTIYCRYTNICGTDTIKSVATINNTVTPSITFTISPNDSICGGDSIVLSSSIVNGGTAPYIEWRKGAISIGSGANLTYHPTSSGNISCVLVSSEACTTDDSVNSAALSISVAPSVTPSISVSVSPNDSVAYLGQTMTFNLDVSYGGSAPLYQWYVDGVAISGATSNTYTRPVYDNDSVYCKLISSVQCATTNVVSSAVKIVYADYLTTGVRTINTMGGIKVYPNPSNGVIHVEGEIGAGNAGIVEVRDVVGRVVYSAVLPIENGRVNSELNLGSQLVNGNYILRIVNGNTDYNMHIVINR